MHDGDESNVKNNCSRSRLKEKGKWDEGIPRGEVQCKRNADKRGGAAGPKPGKGGRELQPYAPHDAEKTNCIITNHVLPFLSLEINDAPVLSIKILDHFSRKKKTLYVPFGGYRAYITVGTWKKLEFFFPESFVRYAEISQLHVLCTTGFFPKFVFKFYCNTNRVVWRWWLRKNFIQDGMTSVFNRKGVSEFWSH